ncbi:MAG: glycosyltransferase [Bacteroidota bacterium]|nr:glycosyltransferase [Bacteroidota bacterium]
MKKVLILAYDFPPYVSVGGLRPYSWYKYFHEFGIYPMVVTRQWDNKYGNHLDYIAPGESNKTIIEESETGTIIRTPYKPNLSNRLLLKYGEKRFRFLRKVITGYYEFMQFLFFIGPKSGLYRGAKQYLKKHKVDVIIATGEPFILFKYASAFSKKFSVPWVADYRDPWTQHKARSSTLFLRHWNAFFEKKYLSNVHFITTVSDFFRHQIGFLIKNKPIHIIPNGFSLPDKLKQNTTSPDTGTLSIAFAGSIYPWHPWKSVLKCLSQLVTSDNVNITITFYGINKADEIKTWIAQKIPKIKDRFEFHSKIDNEQLLSKLSGHNLLLLFNDYSIAGTKIYDYLAVKRRILLCYTNDKEALNLKSKYFPMNDEKGFRTNLQEEIIDYTKSGYTVKNAQQLCDTLFALHQELRENGHLACHSVNVEQFSRKKQVERLANILS